MKLYFLLLLFCQLCFSNENFQELELDGPYSTWTTEGSLRSSLFQVILDEKNPPAAIRISVNFENSTLKRPLIITVIRGKTVHNLALPRIQSHNGQKYEYWFASDILCDNERSVEELSQPVYISISSSLPTSFNLRIQSVNSFLIGTNPFDSIESPPESAFFLYNFPDDVEKVDVKAVSESKICARLTVRRANCPLFDESGLLELTDVYFFQTFTKLAVVSLRKSDIGNQFHIAINVDPDDSNCGGVSNQSSMTEFSARKKKTAISVLPVSDSSITPLLPILIYVFSMILVFLLTFLKYKWIDCQENNEPNIFEGNDSEGNVIIDKIHLFDKKHMVVSHKEYEKQRLVKDTKYFNFLFFQIFGSILPALTTLFQNRQNGSSNLDTCYLNYLCTLDVFDFFSFNAMTSSSSLTVIGMLNLIIVFRKKIFRYQIPRFPTTHGIQQREAPKVVCLLGLIAMGILWMIISNCPQKTTQHFYVYTISWLHYSAILWMYSKRHGVRKWQQFYIIAVSSIFGCFTLAENMLNSSDSSQMVLKVLLITVSFCSTAVFCYKYYYERPSGLQEHQWISRPLNCAERTLIDENGVYQPLKSKIVFVLISMASSIICSSSPFYLTGYTVSTAIYLLIRTQLGIYLIYYYIQKVRFEWSSFKILYAICSFSLAFLVIFLSFVNRYLANYLKTYTLSVTPAQSRENNMEFLLPGIDWNNIRHYNGALICSLFLLLMDYIDSNIKGVPKKHIFVF